jgi:hypothetical protein
MYFQVWIVSITKTVIKYEYINRAGKVISTEETGVVDTVIS